MKILKFIVWSTCLSSIGVVGYAANFAFPEEVPTKEPVKAVVESPMSHNVVSPAPSVPKAKTNFYQYSVPLDAGSQYIAHPTISTHQSQTTQSYQPQSPALYWQSKPDPCSGHTYDWRC